MAKVAEVPDEAGSDDGASVTPSAVGRDVRNRGRDDIFLLFLKEAEIGRAVVEMDSSESSQEGQEVWKGQGAERGGVIGGGSFGPALSAQMRSGIGHRNYEDLPSVPPVHDHVSI